MKKLFCFLAIVATFGLINIPSNAAEAPIYDESYNNNQGAFFANGFPIVISEIDGNTVITWDAGSQIVPSTKILSLSNFSITFCIVFNGLAV